MTEPRSDTEIREQAKLLMAMCDSGKARIEPTDPDDGVGVAWIRVMDASSIAADALSAALAAKAELDAENQRLAEMSDHADTEYRRISDERDKANQQARAALAAKEAADKETRAMEIRWRAACNLYAGSKARAERAEAQVRAVELLHVWTNEDGRRFVFADDLAVALGIPGAAVARSEPQETE